MISSCLPSHCRSTFLVVVGGFLSGCASSSSVEIHHRIHDHVSLLNIASISCINPDVPPSSSYDLIALFFFVPGTFGLCLVELNPPPPPIMPPPLKRNVDDSRSDASSILINQKDPKNASAPTAAPTVSKSKRPAANSASVASQKSTLATVPTTASGAMPPTQSTQPSVNLTRVRCPSVEILFCQPYDRG